MPQSRRDVSYQYTDLTHENTSRSNPGILMKKSILNRLISSVRSEMGSPVRIAQVLHEHQPRPVDLEDPLHPSIDARQAPAWEQMCPPHHKGPGHVDGWRYGQATQRYESFTARVPGYAHLAQKHTLDRWTCDIRDVHGLTHSKSDLSAFRSLSEMAIHKSRDLISDVSIEGLQRNLSHEGIGTSQPLRQSDMLVVRMWNPLVHLHNSGGSHHFAAAQHIAQQLDQSVPLQRQAVFHQINGEALLETLHDYTLYALPNEDAFLNDLHEAMSRFRADYLMHKMPATFGDCVAILLPRSNDRSMAVAQTLKRCGAASLDERLTRVVQDGDANAMRIGQSLSEQPAPGPAVHREREVMSPG